MTVPVAVITSQTSCALAAATRTAPDKALDCLILPLSQEDNDMKEWTGRTNPEKSPIECSSPREYLRLKRSGRLKRSKCLCLTTREKERIERMLGRPDQSERIVEFK